MGFPRWEQATRCTSGPTPGALALMKWFVENYHGKGGYNLGIFNCRSVRGGSTTSCHGEGRADDLGFPVGDKDGDALVRRLLPVVGKLGIQCIIYERRIYSAKSPGGRYYGGADPHKTHLHVELTREAARHLTYATVKVVMAGKSVTRKPGSRSLRKGDAGSDVRFVQSKLGASADGIFGPKTEAAVNKYKSAHKLKADGIVGHEMWRDLGVDPKY